MQQGNVKHYRRQASLSLSQTGVVLQNGRVHEACGTAADAFAVVMAAKLSGPLVWIGRGAQVRSLAPTALQVFFDPRRLVTAGCESRKEILWAAEQALRCGGVAGVIVEMGMGPDLKESRRLQLAAEAGRSLGLIVIGRAAQSSAAQTRWQCEALPCTDAKGESWRWSLQKNKSGRIGTWHVSWQKRKRSGEGDGPSGDVHMVAASAA